MRWCCSAAAKGASELIELAGDRVVVLRLSGFLAGNHVVQLDDAFVQAQGPVDKGAQSFGKQVGARNGCALAIQSC